MARINRNRRRVIECVPAVRHELTRMKCDFLLRNSMIKILTCFIIAAIFGACNNFFHDIIPPDGDRIISFIVPDQSEEAVIGENTIEISVIPEAPINAMLPQITVSERASIIPLTWEYLRAAFPGADLEWEYDQLEKTKDVSAYVWNLIERTPGFNIPPLIMPINFYNTVRFIVISAQGSIREYAVDIVDITNGNRIVSFEVPDQIEDAVIGDNTINIRVKPDANINSMIPRIEVSPHANIVPLTFEYMRAAFPGADIEIEYEGLLNADDRNAYIRDLVTRYPDFTIPPLILPINFYFPVKFIVISARGDIREYTAEVMDIANGNRIESFKVPGQIGESVIGDNSIRLKADPQAAINAMVPVIEISPHATIIPLTYEYIRAAFPTADIEYEYARLLETDDIEEYARSLIARYPDFTIPPLIMPINFIFPVDFLVISARGDIRRYTAEILDIANGNRIESFKVPDQIGEEIISEDTVIISVDPAANIGAMVPQIEISPHATIIPLTFEYMRAAFPDADIEYEYAQLLETDDIEEYARNLIARYPDYKIPPLIMPINFYFPVDFLVISARGDFRRYTAQITDATGGNRILSFEVANQTEEAAIGEDFVSVIVMPGSDINAVLPRVEVSPNAFVIPLTFEYMRAAFPNANLEDEFTGLMNSGDIPAYARDMIARYPDYVIPSLTIPINFHNTVEFLVVSARGEIRLYSVDVKDVSEEEKNPRLLSLVFSKYDNPELISDAVCAINERTMSLTVLLRYPIEMPGLSFALIPSFEILGEQFIVDGNEINSGIDAIQFNQVFGSQIKTLSIIWEGNQANYTLSIVFAEDPDSIRSITDFRFIRSDNSGIAADAVAAIVNNGNTGTITVQVLYSGAKPSNLIARFISPGNVSVGGIPQTSGSGSRDFSTPQEFLVVSKNGQFSRTYTVRVEFFNLTTDAPHILSFGFPAVLNTGLVQDAIGDINDGAGLITVTVRYGSNFNTETLTAEFIAEGLVTVSSAVQISGSSSQDFARRVKYTVSNPQNSLLKREYWVECVFVRDISSDANIGDFGFYPEDNIGLDESLPARIDQETGKISLIAPVGSGITMRLMVPRFNAAGTVSVSSTLQYSGYSSHVFDSPIVYTVVSANGQNRREYIVDVRELSTTIYVNPNATGQNNGLNWNDAYRSLNAACEAAEMFPRETPTEIWIAGGIYTPGTSTDDYFTVAPNTSFIGGFAGTESSKSQRNVSANQTVISGDITKKQPNDIHAAFFSRMVLLDGEDVRFEDMEFRLFMLSQKASPSFIYNPVLIRWNSRSRGTVSVLNCRFVDVNGPCIETFNGSANLQNISADRVAAVYHNSKTISERNLQTADTFENIRVNSQILSGNSGYDPLFVAYSGEYAASSMAISGIVMENVSLGFQIYGAAAAITADNITVRNMTTVNRQGAEKGSILEIDNCGPLSLSNIDIDGVKNGRSFIGTIYVNEPRGNVLIDTVTIKNVTVSAGNEYGGAGGIAINWLYSSPVYLGGRVEIKDVRLENVDQRYLPALSVYKPGAAVYLDDVSIVCNALSYTYNSSSSIWLLSDTAGCIAIESYQTLAVNNIHIEEAGNYRMNSMFSSNSGATTDIQHVTAINTTFTIQGTGNTISLSDYENTTSGSLSISGTRAKIDASDIRIANGNFTISGIDSIATVTGYTNTVSGNFSASGARAKIDVSNVSLEDGIFETSGSYSEVVVDNIETPRYSTSYYKTLYLSNANGIHSLIITGAVDYTETTVLSNVIMREHDPGANVDLTISHPGNLSASDSTFISHYRTGWDTLTFTSNGAYAGNITYMNVRDIYWSNAHNNHYSALFDNCIFDFYVAPRTVSGSLTMSLEDYRYCHIDATGNSYFSLTEPNRYSGRVSLEIRNSVFNLDPNSNTWTHLIQVNGIVTKYSSTYHGATHTGSTLDLNNVAFNNCHPGQLIWLKGSYSYRVSTTSSLNGNLLDTTANQSTFRGRVGGYETITFY